MTPATQQRKANTNGGAPAVEPDALAEAIAHEQAIAEEAAEIREEATDMTPDLFLKLLPLLRRPIPAGFIVTTPATKGKPYPSTGIKSMQVQIDRLDNVLTPLGWSWDTKWSEDFRTADVTVTVWGAGGESVLVRRRARGGVNQGSTDGNILKGSETNAAKLAFARLGVGHEVYLGAADFDPDVDPDAAKEQGKAADAVERKLTPEQAERAEKAVADAGLTEALPHKLRSFGVKRLADLNHEQALALRAWIDERAESAQ